MKTPVCGAHTGALPGTDSDRAESAGKGTPALAFPADQKETIAATKRGQEIRKATHLLPQRNQHGLTLVRVRALLHSSDGAVKFRVVLRSVASRTYIYALFGFDVHLSAIRLNRALVAL